MNKTMLIFTLFMTSAASAGGRPAAWQQVPVARQMTVIDNDGNPRAIQPSCAFDTIQGPDGAAIDNAFHFYFQPGKKKDKVIVFFNGGGACWDDATCVSSLARGARASYNPTVLQQNNPVGAGGIFDDTNNDNAFRDWTKVFIPYCTGDIHVGSNDVTYFDVDGYLTGYPGAPIPVHHRGFDNFLAVLDWMKGQLPDGQTHAKNRVTRLLVTGSSAGAYGATLNFPYVKNAFPKADATLLSDGGAAVISQGFLDSVFVPGGNWNVEASLDAQTFGTAALGTFLTPTFNATLLSRLATAYPESRFAQYTTAFDAVQVQFLKLMTMLDAGVFDPAMWSLTDADLQLFGMWNYVMESSFDQLAANVSNYQYYIGAGTIHTILTDAFATVDVPHPFYDESTAEGVLFSQWLGDLVNSEDFPAQSVKYSN